MRKKVLRATSLFMALIMCVLLLVACGSSSGKLVGRWSKTDGGTSINSLEFFSDGTYTSDYPNYYGSYSVDGNRIRLSGVLIEDMTMSFEVKDDTLTFYRDDGERVLMTFEKSN